MSPRRTKASALIGTIVATILIASIGVSTEAFAIETLQFDNGGRAKYLPLSEFRQHVKGSINATVEQVPGAATKRLVLSGRLNSACFGLGAGLRLVKHPRGKMDQLLVVASLNDYCQVKVDGVEGITAQNVPVNLTHDQTRELATLGDLQIPADFSGTIHFCALKDGSEILNDTNFNQRANCEQLGLSADRAGILKESGEVLGLTETIALEAAAERAKQEEARRRRDVRRVHEIVRVYQNYFSSCNNVARANAAARQLGAFGIEYQHLIEANNARALDQVLLDLEDANSLAEVDQLVRNFENLARSIPNVDKAAFADLAIQKMEEIVEAQIDDIEDMDSREARRAMSDIQGLKNRIRTLAGRDGKDRANETVANLYEKLANRASREGDLTRALEIAEIAANSLPGDLALDFVEAQRNALVKQYEKCVEKRADKGNSNFEKCGKIQRKVAKVQEHLEEEAGYYASESDQERYQEDGEELLGSPDSFVQLPWGPMVQPGTPGSMDIFLQQAMQEAYAQMLRGNGAASSPFGPQFGSPYSNQFNFGQQNFANQRFAGVAAPLGAGGGMRSFSSVNSGGPSGFGGFR